MFTMPKRSKGNMVAVVSEQETKEYKVVFKKRRLMDNIDLNHMDSNNLFIYFCINRDVLTHKVHFIA